MKKVTLDELTITPADIRSALFQLVKSGAILATACGIIFGAVWFAISPRVELYLDERSAPMRDLLTKIQSDLLEIKLTLENVPEGPFIEFQGRGLIDGAGPFRAGMNVPITYSLRRNRPCKAEVLVHFRSRELQRLITSLNYVVPDTQVPVTNEFIDFTIDVRLPETIRPGWYAYRAILVPETSCGHRIAVPFSDYFEVVDR